VQPDHDVPPGLSVAGVLLLVTRHPWRYVARRWNYKSAAMSSLFRGLLFFAVNLSAGLGAALGAMSAEFILRFATAGFYGALTQAFRRAEPERAATIAVMVLLPLVGHSVELAMHWARGTPRLAESILASVALTALSTAFNLFAMRRGALIIGDGSRSLLQDLAMMPSLFAAFIFSWRSRRSI